MSSQIMDQTLSCKEWIRWNPVSVESQSNTRSCLPSGHISLAPLAFHPFPGSTLWWTLGSRSEGNEGSSSQEPGTSSSNIWRTQYCVDSGWSNSKQPPTTGSGCYGCRRSNLTYSRAFPYRQTIDSTSLQCRHHIFDKRWNLVERINTDLWVQWRTHYLQSMQARNKWQTPSRKFCIGDIVVVKDDTLVQRTWPLGRIVKLYPGSDNLVRTADIICNGKEYNRAINWLVLLVSAESIDSS